MIYSLIVIITFSCNYTYSQHISELNSKTYLDCYILESNFDPGNYLFDDIGKLGFVQYNWTKTPYKRPINDRMITLRSKFSIDSSFRNDEIFLALFTSDYPYHIYLNGHLISVFGTFQDAYTSRKLFSSSILLPVDFVHYNKDSINELAIQLYPKQGEVTSFCQPFLASAEIVTSYVFWKNFWGYSLVRTITFLCFLISFYFFLIYFLRKSLFVNHYLYYALYNVFIAIAYLNNVVNYDFANTFIYEKIVRTAFILQGASLTGFFLIYTNFPRKKIILTIVNSVSVIVAFIAFIQPDLKSVNLIWSSLTSPLLLIFNVLVLVITGRYLLKTRKFAAWLFFLTYLAHMLAAMHDLYYFVVIQVRPYALFTPFLIFIFTLVIFAVLAEEQTKTYILSIIQAKKLKALSDGLEIKVTERTKQLSETVSKLNTEIERHKHTQKQLEEINVTKNKFFSIIAHDLKTPFHGLLGYSNLLTTSIKKSDLTLTSKYAKQIHTSSVNAYNLLENLLIWAGSQTGKFEFNPEGLDIKNSVDENIRLVVNQALAKNINVVNMVLQKEVWADKYMIDTIMRNLLTNAIKFTHIGGEIRVSSVENEDKIEICVADNGIGIEKEHIDKLFRIDTKHTTAGTMEEKGTGLGLLLCKEFIEKHGERLWVESEPGQGSKFKFTLKKTNSKE
ncbi:ATP-binding protein [Bacteroidota bacterium]